MYYELKIEKKISMSCLDRRGCTCFYLGSLLLLAYGLWWCSSVSCQLPYNKWQIHHPNKNFLWSTALFHFFWTKISFHVRRYADVSSQQISWFGDPAVEFKTQQEGLHYQLVANLWEFVLCMLPLEKLEKSLRANQSMKNNEEPE